MNTVHCDDLFNSFGEMLNIISYMIFIAHERCEVVNLLDNDENWIILFFL